MLNVARYNDDLGLEGQETLGNGRFDFYKNPINTKSVVCYYGKM